MWQNIAALVLLTFGVVVAIIIVIIYLRMYRKQRQSQEKCHDSASFDHSSNDEQVL
ncbi:hypothetical protein [Paenibacillus endoradicis]|uniref:hypothetical protein n=1 Tax=Paenibacillus endoradicis TaxID=2972487 RepID=UPI002159A494|nr:hypothetical protein [Paenibacillus endoradicis]MCR8657406.1 hypothetical protein [Paenibacillus endoradicis]